MRDSWLAPHRDFDSQAFLERVKSPRLRDMPALALWVPDAARAYNIREEWLLAVIEKEQTGVRARTLSRHAQDWLCGFGYTEGPKLTQFKGARNQVYSCARGLRRYLTPGDSLYVGGWVGKPWTERGGETRVVRSLVEAVCLQYTPHWSTLQTMESLWREFGFEDGDAAMPARGSLRLSAPLQARGRVRASSAWTWSNDWTRARWSATIAASGLTLPSTARRAKITARAPRLSTVVLDTRWRLCYCH